MDTPWRKSEHFHPAQDLRAGDTPAEGDDEVAQQRDEKQNTGRRGEDLVEVDAHPCMNVVALGLERVGERRKQQVMRAWGVEVGGIPRSAMR